MKKINDLKTMASNFRDKYGDTDAVEMASLFCHFAPQFQRRLPSGKWVEVLQRFIRGPFDHELAGRVAHKDLNLMVDSFRSLQMFGATAPQAVPELATAVAEEAAAALEQEQSDFKLAGRRLQNEVAKWGDYRKEIHKWQCQTYMQKRV